MLKMKDKNLIHILIDRELKEELFAEATAKGLPLSTYIRMILMERDK